MKPRDAAAVLFCLKFADNIHYKLKSSNLASFESHASELQTSGLPWVWRFPWRFSWVWVWGLWWIPMGLWEFCGDFWVHGCEIKRKRIKCDNVIVDIWISPNRGEFWVCFNGIFEFFLHYHYSIHTATPFKETNGGERRYPCRYVWLRQ